MSFPTLSFLLLTIIVSVSASVDSKTYFNENFNDAEWTNRWVVSQSKPENEIGAWNHTAGTWYVDEGDKGIKTGNDARFYGISSKLQESLNNANKDLVIQFLVKHEQNIDCGGAYIKLLRSDLDQSTFSGDSEYAIMFGPDICGATKKVHVIFNYSPKKGNTQPLNLEHKSVIHCETDEHAHLYTLIVRKDNTYEVKIDGQSKQSGDLKESFSFLPEKEIQDPAQSKPVDWVNEAQIPDPSDTKPQGYDEIPRVIPDPQAEKPEDWDEDDDGEWEAPMIDNPEYKGPWQPKMIANPEYKGEWIHPMIPNPDYYEDDLLHARCQDCSFIGFELWQVKAGTWFDDILVTDDIEEAEAAEKIVLEKIASLKEAKQIMDDEIEKAIKEEEESRGRERAEDLQDLDEDEEDEEDDFERDEL